MCGAFSILHPFREGWDRPFNAGYNGISIPPRYNARPGQKLPVILNTKPNEFQLVLWGYMPNWDKARPIINARKDSLDTKVTFEESFRKRRCIIPADGFYEWAIVKGKKIPFRFQLKTQKIFAFAGIWKENTETNQPEFTIITTEPNELVSKAHNRMPAILPKNHELEWLDDKLSRHDLLSLLSPYPANLMKAYPVSTLVNSANNDFKEIIKPVKI